jgi:predicted PurR-regulated permease PerM
MIDIAQYQKYVLPILFVGIIILSYFVVKPFLMVIIAAAILAYMFFPIYEWIRKKIKIKWVASLLVIALLIFLISVPIFMVLTALVDQAGDAYGRSREYLTSMQDMDFLDCPDETITETTTLPCKLKSKYLEIFGTSYLKEAVSKITSALSYKVYGILSSLPGQIFNLIIMLFLMFFFLIDGKKLTRTIKGLLPMHIKHERYIMDRLKATTHAVVFGQIIVAAIQGFLGGIGFLIVGLPNPILWGTLMGFMALIPMIGTAVIWVPAGIFMIIQGLSANQIVSWIGPGHSVVGGIVLLAYGVLIVSSIDNVLRPMIIGERAKLHPALVFLGVLGGLQIFGILGIIVGPIVLGILITFIDIYELEKANSLNGKEETYKTQTKKKK